MTTDTAPSPPPSSGWSQDPARQAQALKIRSTLAARGKLLSHVAARAALEIGAPVSEQLVGKVIRGLCTDGPKTAAIRRAVSELAHLPQRELFLQGD